MLLIYGANGYTGELLARRAAERKLPLVLGGRRADAVARLGGELGVPHQRFALDDDAAVVAGIAGATVVLNAAGPFSRTALPLARACLRAGAHYLDVTGEIAVFEALAARDAEARAAGVMLLPGVGFDVVPTDCLAAHLHRRLPSATRLCLGFQPGGGGFSRGTARTAVEGLGQGGMVRVAGALTPVPAAWKTRVIDFGRGPARAVTIPWGDVATAFHTTGIPNIEVYLALPAAQRLGLRATRVLGPVLGWGPVRSLLLARIATRPAGPTAEARARGETLVWGEATSANGDRVVSRLRTPEAYGFTALSAVKAAENALAGQAPAGFQTPARAYGADFVLGFEGVSRTDE